MYNNKYVKKLTSHTFDIDKLRNDLDNKILSKYDIHAIDNQLNFTHIKESYDKLYEGNGGYYPFDKTTNTYDTTQPLRNESDYKFFNDDLKDTYFYEIYNKLSTTYDIGRMRLMLIHRKRCLSWHRDLEWRLHIPIHTGIGAFMTFETEEPSNYYSAHLPGDGSAYMCDVRNNHSASNASLSDYKIDDKDVRINLLIDIIDTKLPGLQRIKDKNPHDKFTKIE